MVQGNSTEEQFKGFAWVRFERDFLASFEDVTNQSGEET